MAFNLVRYSQQDPAWKNNKLGSGPDTLGYMGCAVACVAMYSSGWGYTETPATLNLKLNANGGFVHEAIVWSAISKFHPHLQCTGLTLCMTTDAPLAQIDASLSAGQPVIIEVDFSPAAGLQTHWLLVYGKQGDDYLVQDPWPYPAETGPVTLLSRYSQGQPLRRAIKAVAFYVCEDGATVPPLPPPAPLPDPIETDLVLQPVATATAGIKLRVAPALDAYANYAEMPGTALQVIEDAAAALAKLGKWNEWIYVRDPNAHQGYVAAWYVEVSPAPVPAPTPPEPPPAVPPTPPPASEPQRMQVVVLPIVGVRGLPVRQQPSLGSPKVNDEKAGARLTVIEPPDSALAKIGKPGQWLAIKATNNQRGFVMAQYVMLRQ